MGEEKREKRMTLKDVDKLKEFISDTWILDRIDELPTVDAVEVVRCKYCIHYGNDCVLLFPVCGYCYDGKRKKEEG